MGVVNEGNGGESGVVEEGQLSEVVEVNKVGEAGPDPHSAEPKEIWGYGAPTPLSSPLTLPYIPFTAIFYIPLITVSRPSNSAISFIDFLKYDFFPWKNGP